MADTFTAEETKAIDQIQKLLNLAAKNSNEHEAAAATAKAQALLAKYNLDSAAVAGAAPQEGRREQQKVEGGFYAFHREMWRAVAELNFCIYWTQAYYVRGIRKRYNAGLPPVETNIRKHRHCLVGKIVNTRSTMAMAQYLETAIERVVKERIKGNDLHHMSNWAVSFRRGCFDRVIEMLQDRRRKFIDEEEKRQREAARKASGASTATALTIGTLAQQEKDANMDFIYGEGWSAKRRAEQAARAAEAARKEAEYTAWAKSNPEEARKREAELKARYEKENRRYRGGRTQRDNTDYSAYYSGYDAGAGISLDQQVDTGSASVPKLGRR